MNPLKILIPALLGLFALMFVGGSFYTVDPGERGVVVRLGSIAGTADPGFHLKLPFVDTVKTVSVQTHVLRFEKLASYSKDQQPADLAVSVNYQIPEGAVADVVAHFGDEKALVSRLLQPRVYEELKTTFGQFSAVTAIQERARLSAAATLALQNAVKGPVQVLSIQIENIDFSDVYEKSIEQRMQAEVEVQKLRQNADREKVQAEITVTVARAQADAIRQKAQAEAEALKLQGEAQAAAIRARGAALKDNPALVALTAAERWNGTLPTHMVPNGAVPFVNLEATK